MNNPSIELAGIKLKNRVMVASGTFGYGEEYSELINLNKLGAIITKSVSLNKRQGNPPPRICETPSGMLNTIGLQNDGLKEFIEKALPFLSKFDTPVIVNIAGENAKEFEELARTLSKENLVKGLEINISCPNVQKGGMQFGCSVLGTEEIVKIVRSSTELPIIVKLSPNVTDITEIALTAEKAGADAVSLINTVMGMAVDVKKKEFGLSTKTGGLSGPAIKPIAVRMVWQVAQVVKIPIIGIGGIMTAEDALEFFMVGASAVQVGTANFVDVNSAINIIQDLEKYDLEKLKGILK
ncbi:dihydroorotate dehydrogenase B catalytic subunit [candidate division WOR-1 bacterium RIFOXYC2_FULL_37_10]|uniref:Dihydroorotate dehydrogenase n=1 Tax=candidate division WOR-1 bacterium RIFOXYB2_FULL_37_13 TaxID=1802579 RepID=A0A1F4SLS5_UNCSA|nr:MAG: dihydroorotate dehydrogenase B catalytic subunit [candidate division WOR-1 bacterium RIFOXYA2_FULL_37_7]OGC21386.1 MAG: dihydroorotate dehydrogenase B catalytic subunit [candidate division WOR-1 bacterium RIFOXYB2_FULL_37_13]OGC33450.1 MAG: dihydroorotate dehydrogenase B catalytic subunit [candidate division WOR-1 bacterium RIFOXYC2_FULL_37_10]